MSKFYFHKSCKNNHFGKIKIYFLLGIDDVVQYSNMRSWKQYKFINSSSIENKLMAVCKLLGELGDFEVLVDTLLKLIFDMQQYRKELTLLLNWIVKGTVK